MPAVRVEPTTYPLGSKYADPNYHNPMSDSEANVSWHQALTAFFGPITSNYLLKLLFDSKNLQIKWASQWTELGVELEYRESWQDPSSWVNDSQWDPVWHFRDLSNICREEKRTNFHCEQLTFSWTLRNSRFFAGVSFLRKVNSHNSSEIMVDNLTQCPPNFSRKKIMFEWKER